MAGQKDNVMNWRKICAAPLAWSFCFLLVLLASGCNGVQNFSPWNLSGSGQSSGQSSGRTSGGYGRYAGAYDFPSGRPFDFKEFKERYQSVGTTPEGAVRMYFDAVYSYIDPARKAEGSKMLRYSMHEGRNWERSSALATFVSRLNDPSFHYIFRSFAEGTSPENSYDMNPDSYRLMFANTRQETDYVYVSIRSSGADSPRPLHVQEFEDGLWYVINNHGTYSDVRTPANRVRKGGHDADRD